jgi:hypothetical protein
MVKSEMKATNAVLLTLPGYRVVALKPEFDEHTIELEQVLQEGISAHPDLVRTDFYDVALQDGWAYIHVYRAGHAVYLVAHSGNRQPISLTVPENYYATSPGIQRNGLF